MAQRIVNMFLSVLAAYGTLILTKHMSIANNIFVTQIVRLIICVVAVIIVTGITTYIFRNKSSNK
ncbi:hypothetical protein H8R29_08235 [Priestia megaterium]|jgi:hypothetical protein|uniref:Putative membrane protein n=1 Tax=Priestia megaterium (strain ATCC 14581 / DSM 32 / CCUG 1817 / JCM 2506 / NBRC 15308 / NCIMB 9376 / NCTC 10342 / NRRL B-14308 / VKM B-512 / Ford 19) TaxID=1348623 RepID=A0A0B6APX8_PRIM2|nr:MULTISPECIES: hypothetical protein [Priestia]AJI21874.1 putative membrane protein [Priestia megaterium NBRC 15308 = ATCC 14581]AYE51960.1 hypothetical protein OEA_20185 [Priestia megaterium NCT-2]KFM96545.1 putative membrane protein [Priestia megaterium]KGJ85051.1 hypothetical protein BMT_03000 [Priestia megaterium NBRC 15308 = ATCC 14581]MBU8753720.1 hypothetical protein [Priestia megaterium]